MKELLLVLSVQEKQLISYAFITVIAALMLVFIVVLAMKIKAANDEKKSEVLPSLAELGLDGDGIEDFVDEEEVDDDDISSAFYDELEDEPLEIDNFLDRK